MYLLWFDDNGKKAASIKIAEGIAAYTDRFHTRPNTVLVNKDEVLGEPVAGVTIRDVSYVRKSNFWIGRTDD